MDSELKVITAVCLAHFQDGKILMARDQDVPEQFYFVGGGIEEGESENDCLIREVKEEIGCELEAKDAIFLAEFEDIAHGRANTIVKLVFYTAKELKGEPKASGEVAELAYFDSTVEPKFLTDVAINKVYPWLKEKGLIN